MIHNNDDGYDFSKPTTDPRHDDKHFPLVTVGNTTPTRALLENGEWNNPYLNAVAAFVTKTPDPVPPPPAQPTGIEGVDWEQNALGDRVPIKISADRHLLLTINGRLAKIEEMLTALG